VQLWIGVAFLDAYHQETADELGHLAFLNQSTHIDPYRGMDELREFARRAVVGPRVVRAFNRMIRESWWVSLLSRYEGALSAAMISLLNQHTMLLILAGIFVFAVVTTTGRLLSTCYRGAKHSSDMRQLAAAMKIAH